MDPTKRFWNNPELGEKLIGYLDPMSQFHLVHLVQSDVMEKKTLQKSLTFKAWSELIRRTSVVEYFGIMLEEREV